MDEQYQKRTYALTIFFTVCIFGFWALCITAPLQDVEFAKYIGSALVPAFMAMVYFFYRKPKKPEGEE